MIWPDCINTVVHGDALTMLRQMPDGVIQTCISSPPYWGLRDYGIEGQLGLERTPELYVAKIVKVFREVRRVLRDDGTLWLNLGSSYMGSGGAHEEHHANPGISKSFERGGVSHGTSPSQSHSDALACGNDDKESQCSQVDDRACLDSYDERQDETLTHYGNTSHIDQSERQDGRPTLPTDHDNGHLDYDPTSPAASSPDVQASKVRASWRRDRAACVPSTKASVSRQETQTSSPCVLSSSDNSACNSGTSQKLPPSVSRTQDKESSFSASKTSNGLISYNLTTMFHNVKFKPKDLVPIPWMVAMALQADGWYLRSDIIWSKPNPMPESVTDRPTKAHEYLFLLAKSQQYYYDADAIKEDAIHSGRVVKASNPETAKNAQKGKYGATAIGFTKHDTVVGDGRNKRSVWTIATEPHPFAHFATFPIKLIEPCILAGSKEGSIVLDPFMGSGTVGLRSQQLGRQWVGIELNQEYIKIANQRLCQKELFATEKQGS